LPEELETAIGQIKNTAKNLWLWALHLHSGTDKGSEPHCGRGDCGKRHREDDRENLKHPDLARGSAVLLPLWLRL